jgi:hypothetical protein
MNLTHREQANLEQQEIIALTTTRLAPLRRYEEPTRPPNDNRNQDNNGCNACLRLADKVGSSWRIRRASLLVITNKPLWIIILSLL